MRDLVEVLRRFEIRVHTAALILGGIAIWAVVTIRDVDKKTDLIQRDVTVLQENAKYIREDIQRIREITDTTKNAVKSRSNSRAPDPTLQDTSLSVAQPAFGTGPKAK